MAPGSVDEDTPAVEASSPRLACWVLRKSGTYERFRWQAEERVRDSGDPI